MLKGPKRHILSSLRVDTLQSSDFLSFSGQKKLKVYFSKQRSELPLQLVYDTTTTFLPWPPSAAGYLYYHPPPPGAPLAGSLRLRINSDNAAGNDLRLPSGVPWQLILPQLVHYKHCAGALRKLVSEDLLTPADVERCRALFPKAGKRAPFTIFHLHQPFPLELTQTDLRLRIVGRDRLALFIKGRLFGDPAPRYPFRGSVLARFELAPEGGRVLMRIVETVSPVSCVVPGYTGRLVMPRAGDLLMYTYDGITSPWSINLASKTGVAAALRLLVESSTNMTGWN